MGKGSKRFRSGNKKAKKQQRKILEASMAVPRIKKNLSPTHAAASELDSGMPVVDALGRVNGQTYPAQDNVPDYLKNSAKPEEKSEEKSTLTRKITIVKDGSLEYPTLCFKVFVQPDPAVGGRVDEARYAKMFARSQCRRAESVLEADLVVFSGGSDVDPTLYGETPHPSTYISPKRDQQDMDLYLLCLEHGIPMFGVCRGAQFLHVMNGGKLFQDVDNHNGSHPMWDLFNKKHIEKVSSVHHQMCRSNTEGGMQIIATASRSTERYANEKNVFVGSHIDIEAFFYRETCCVGVQGHPEYEGYDYFTKWTLDLLEDLVFNNPDLYWDDSATLRMRPELLAQRLSRNPTKAAAKLPKSDQAIVEEFMKEVEGL
jgi:gamma-glutamyl-gamma-aminobutyrate hydrolase PuuD